MTGKEKCKLLKQIRKEIAKANGIIYLSSECDYSGNDCLGTCAKCDAEIRYLDTELNRKAAAGETVTISGISLTGFELDNSSTGHPLGTHPTIVEKGSISRNSVLQMAIEELDLSVRSYNCLKRAGIETVKDLISLSDNEICHIRNMGKKSFKEISQKLGMLGIVIAHEENQ